MESGNNQPPDRSDLQNNLDNASEQLWEGGSENKGEQEPPPPLPPRNGNGHDLPEPPDLIADSELHIIPGNGDPDPPAPLD